MPNPNEFPMSYQTFGIKRKPRRVIRSSYSAFNPATATVQQFADQPADQPADPLTPPEAPAPPERLQELLADQPALFKGTYRHRLPNMYTSTPEEIRKFYSQLSNLPADQQKNALIQFETAPSAAAPNIERKDLTRLATDPFKMAYQGAVGVVTPGMDNLLVQGATKAFEVYNHAITKIIADGIWFAQDFVMPGQQEMEKKIRLLMQETGMPAHEAAHQVYMEVDFPPYVKGILETVVDVMLTGGTGAGLSLATKPVTFAGRKSAQFATGGDIGRKITQSMTPPPVQPHAIVPDLTPVDVKQSTMFQDDVSRQLVQTIKNSPIGSLFKKINPAAVASNPEDKFIILRSALIEEGQQKAMVEMQTLNRIGVHERIWGKRDVDGLLYDPVVPAQKGMTVEEIMGSPAKMQLTRTQQEYTDQFLKINDSFVQFLERNGITINKRAVPEGDNFIPLRVYGKRSKDGSVVPSAFIGGKKSIGGKMATERPRWHKTSAEGRAAGNVYLPENEMLFQRLVTGYKKVADEMAAEWLLRHTKWRPTSGDAGLKAAIIGSRARVKSAKNKVRSSERSLIKSNKKLTQGQKRAALDKLNKEAAADNLADRTALARIRKLTKDGKPLTKKELGIITQSTKGILSRAKRKAKSSEKRLQKLSENNEAAFDAFQKGTRALDEEYGKLNEMAEAWKRNLDASRELYAGEGVINQPVFAAKIFTAGQEQDGMRIAATINKALQPQVSTLLKNINDVNALARLFKLGGDLSAPFIQLYFMAGANPIAWTQAIKASFKAMADPTFHSKNIARNKELLARHPDLILTKGGGTEFTEAMAQGGLISRLPQYGKAGMVSKGVVAPLKLFQRGFESALDEAGMQMARALEGRAKNAVDMANIDAFINEFRGLVSAQRLGISSTQQAFESLALLAPRYNRAIASLIYDVFRGGLRGDLARKHMARATIATVFLGYGISTLVFNESFDEAMAHMDISDPDFMTWEVFGQRVGPGTKIRSVMRLLAESWEDIGVEDNPNKLLELSMENPGLRFLRGNTSPAIGWGYNLLWGRDFLGEPTRGEGEDIIGWESLEIVSKTIGTNFVPIWVESMLLNGEGGWSGRAVRGATELIGLRATPETKYDMWVRHAEKTLGKPVDSFLPAEKKRMQFVDVTGRELWDVFQDDLHHKGRVDIYYIMMDQHRMTRNNELKAIDDALNTGKLDYVSFRKRLQESNRRYRLRVSDEKAKEKNQKFLKEMKARDRNPSEMDYHNYLEIIYNPELDDPIDGFNYALRAEQVEAFRKKVGASRWKEIEDAQKIWNPLLPQGYHDYRAMIDQVKPYWNIGENLAASMGLTKEYQEYRKQHTNYAKDLVAEKSGRNFQRLLQLIDRDKQLMRFRDANVDSLLVQWYGYSPRHRDNLRQKQGFPKDEFK